ncbi:armadillo repeat-containing protein 10 [Delphinapterus leucas]|uniref:Armadillo repeat-containing protein 10 n=2 Tax=Monodontidae TaxID=9747 RepID=A0A2Y9LY78_DELLE|nr:armadillo repeat-containing protein 10 [Delphinapterus leucas]
MTRGPAETLRFQPALHAPRSRSRAWRGASASQRCPGNHAAWGGGARRCVAPSAHPGAEGCREGGEPRAGPGVVPGVCCWGVQSLQLFTQSRSLSPAPRPDSRKTPGRVRADRAVSERRSSVAHFLSPSARTRTPAAPSGFGLSCGRPSAARGPSGSMGGARDVGWVAAGLVLAAGACYCFYRLTRGRRRGVPGLRLRPSRSAEDLTNGSYDEILNAEQLQKLLYLLESTEDPVIIERALVTLGNNAAFSVNQVTIRELGGIPIIGSKINNPNQSIKEKALNALNNLSVNVENQIKIKVYVSQVCEDVFSGPLNSAVQLAGLRLLTNMTVTNDHQHMLSSYITDLFHLLLTGNGSTKVQVLKLLLNLSENPAMTDGLLGAKVDSSFLSLYDGHVAKEILLRVLTLFQNITTCLEKEGRLAIQPTFTEGSLFYLLYGEECAQKMRALVYHHDADVKEKVTMIPKF